MVWRVTDEANNAVVPDDEAAFATRRDRMAAFDAMPQEVRDAINYATDCYCPVNIKRGVERGMARYEDVPRFLEKLDGIRDGHA